MAAKQTTDGGENILASVIASGGLAGQPGAAPASDGSLAELQQLLLQKTKLEMEKLRKEITEGRDREAELAVFRASTTASVEANRRNKEQLQAVCSHRKEDGRTHLAGQRLQNGKTFLICQGCFKEFYGTDQIPPNLMPPGHMVGGPLMVSG